jgi:hypothetical protein
MERVGLKGGSKPGNRFAGKGENIGEYKGINGYDLNAAATANTKRRTMAGAIILVAARTLRTFGFVHIAVKRPVGTGHDRKYKKIKSQYDSE